MKLLIILLIPVLIFIYLNRTYARIYDYRTPESSRNPNTDKAYLLEKEGTGSAKYVALGDSLTAGVGSSTFEKTYPYLIAQKLQEKAAEVILFNLATPGAVSADVLKNQIPQAIKQNPDYITLLIGVNDIHNLISAGKFRTNYRSIIGDLTQKTQANIIVINIPYLGSKKLVYPPYDFLIDYRTKQFNQIIEAESKNSRVKLIDLYSKTKPYLEGDRYYSRDLFHPSEEGYILWESLIDEN